MQEAEEQDTCRICSAPAEPDQPLFHPCKCSGTIRYIHQDCLTTWLAHSKKKDCDVCKHPYSFNKVYSPDMPARLPPVLLLRHLAKQLFFTVLFSIRVVLVGLIWLAVLPWLTVWTWRMYFTMGDSAAWWLSNRPRNVTQSASHYYRLSLPSFNYTLDGSPEPPLLPRILSKMKYLASWRTLSADIFAGQIIASLIVLTFVTVFLLREWIAQNARPGVFDDDELPVLAGDEDALQAEQPAPLAPAPDALIEPPPPVEAQNNRVAPLDTLARPDDVRGSQPASVASSSSADSRVDEGDAAVLKKKPRVLLPRNPSRSQRKERKGREVSSEGESSDRAEGSSQQRLQRLHMSQKTHDLPEDVTDSEESWTEGELSHSDGRLPDSVVAYPVSDDDLGNYEFTFRSSRQVPMSSSVEDIHSSPDPFINELSQASPATPLLPAAATGSSSADLLEASSYQRWSRQSGEPDIVPNTPGPALRRPPLPLFTLQISDGSPSSQSLKSVPDRNKVAQTPLASPNLATYRAPEEFDVEGSKVDGYFHEEEVARRQLAREFHQYFRDEDRPEGEAGKDYSGPLPDSSEDEEDDEEEEDLDDDSGDGVWDFDLDEEVIIRQGGEGDDVRPNEPVGIIQGPAAQAGDNAQIQEIPDDMEGNVEDDVEGAMEAIGLRGPIHGVIQNAALMVFVLDTAIGLGIWLPFTIGKLTALLSLDPQRFLELIHLPIRAMRIITDPIVDSVMFLLLQLVLPAFLNYGLRTFGVILSPWFSSGSKVLDRDVLEKGFVTVTKLLRKAYTWIFPLSGTVPSDASKTWLTTENWLVQRAEDYFALLGERVRVTTEQLRSTWIRLSVGQGTVEKVFAVLLGYAVVGLCLALYLNVLTVGNVKSAGRAVRNAVRQQLLVMKVAMFILIELVLFPLGCGIMLDLCTIWLLPDVTIHSRIMFFVQATVTAMFYHWVAGTMFMYQFAILLAGCRSIMRPGAMWFIKDPQDQNFHPIRDILDRPTLVQLRKLGVSAVMYALVVICGVASVAGLLALGHRSILPFRWKNREPLSNVPIDLLFLHIVMPYTVHYFRPKKVLQKTGIRAWRYMAARLRLTSYMFGERRVQEEYTSKHWTWSTLFLDSGIHVDDPENIHDGDFRRVPAADNIALPRDMRATAAVDENGQPIDEEARQIIAAQDAEVTKAKRNIQDDYKVVYLPPGFRERILLFILLLWIAGSMALATVVALPLQVGRMFFRLVVPHEVHDGYSFIAGFYLLWVCYLFGLAVDRMDRRRQRRGRGGPRGDLSIYVVKHGLVWLTKVVYLVAFLGFVIPTLMAIVMELYFLLPLRLSVKPNLQLRLRIVDMWALGLLYAKISYYVSRRRRRSRLMRALERMATNGWNNPDPVSATKDIILPALAGLLPMILVPAAILTWCRDWLHIPLNDRFLFQFTYPAIFTFMCLTRLIAVLLDVTSSWIQTIRDKEFLVEMRLRNHDPEADKQEEERSPKEGTEDFLDN